MRRRYHKLRLMLYLAYNGNAGMGSRGVAVILIFVLWFNILHFSHHIKATETHMSLLDGHETNKIATRILSDYDSHSLGTIFADGLRLGIEEAWRLQAAVAKLRENRGEKVIGYKIGCVSEVHQKALGITHPVLG